jgi:hypothetical protein
LVFIFPLRLDIHRALRYVIQALGLFSAAQLKAGVRFGSSVTTTATVTWSLSFGLQLIGLSLLAYRAISTPAVFMKPTNRGCSIWPFFWVVVESGCMYTFLIIIALVLCIRQPLLLDIPAAALAQISVSKLNLLDLS